MKKKDSSDGGRKYYWKCPDAIFCGFKVQRPKEFLFQEETAIERIAKREYSKLKKDKEFKT